jgi:hypothetical protein
MMNTLDGAIAQPAGGATPLSRQGVSAKGAHQAYAEVQRCIRLAWCRVRAYRELTEMERDEGNEIAARRWAAYRADSLRSIRLLRESVR